MLLDTSLNQFEACFAKRTYQLYNVMIKNQQQQEDRGIEYDTMRTERNDSFCFFLLGFVCLFVCLSRCLYHEWIVSYKELYVPFRSVPFRWRGGSNSDRSRCGHTVVRDIQRVHRPSQNVCASVLPS